MSKPGETTEGTPSGDATLTGTPSQGPHGAIGGNLHPELQNALGVFRSNNLVLAESLLRQFLHAHPTEVVALKLLAEIAMKKGDLRSAETLFAKCIELAPGYAAAKHRFALLLVTLKKFGPAKAQLEELLRSDARNLNYRSLMAYTLGHVGEYERALQYHEEVVREVPDQPRAWMAYANDLRAAGRQEDCITALRRVIELKPSFGEAYWTLSDLRTFHFSPAEIECMRTQLARPDLALHDRVFFHFSLAREFDDVERYEDAFDEYKKGNALQRSTIDYDADRITNEFSRLKEVFTAEFFNQRSAVGCRANDPIFIVSLPRSGSTLVEQILSAHPAIEGTRELPTLQTIAGQIKGAFPNSLRNLNDGEFERMGQQYLDETRVFRKLGRPHFIDKMPSNFAYAGLIQLMLPFAKIIDVRRHPLDCCLANFKQLFSSSLKFSYSLADVGRYYRDYVDLMAHFDDVLPGKNHRVIYEQLVNDPEKEVRSLLNYLGLPFEQECMRFYESNRAVRTPSSEQVRMPIYNKAIGGWRKYESKLEQLKKALGPVLDNYPASAD
jgi:tetratricopeptide (TPR) repeat protein